LVVVDEKATAKIGSNLPDIFHPEWADKVPPDLIGSRIVGFGSAPAELKIEGGGLIVDYVPAGAQSAKRLVLIFTEAGMWIDYLGPSGVVT
jgi:hypothetical protein